MSRRAVTSEKDAKREGERKKLAREQRAADVRAVLSTPEGRRYFWGTVDFVAGFFGLSMTGNNQTFFLEGKRSVGAELVREAQKVAPELYVRALTEALEAQSQEAVHAQAVESQDTEE